MIKKNFIAKGITNNKSSIPPNKNNIGVAIKYGNKAFFSFL